MVGWLDSDSVRVTTHLVAAAAAFYAWHRERQQRSHYTYLYLWPPFWLLTGGLFLAWAFARAADLGGLATELGREQARSHDWYDDRRKVQAIAAGTVGAVWLIVVLVAVWRVPARRRRYLPAAIATFTLMCFIGTRLISLHQIDSVLYRREIAGARIGDIAEFTLVVIVVALTLRPPRAGYAPLPDPPARVVNTGPTPK
jgi:hypothetical protein